MHSLPILLLAASVSVQCATGSLHHTDATGSADSDLLNRAERIEIGPFQSRALWTRSKVKAPAILMIPGSGPQGPEEMIPAAVSSNGEDNAVFNQLAAPFIKNGFNVLQLGKPGVDFFSGWPTQFYDREMAMAVSWADLLANAKAGLAFLRSQSTVDISQIYLLGHSEGTQVVTDIAPAEKDVRAIVLLGYSGHSLLETLRWQLYQREVDHFLRPDLDANSDGFVSRDEAANWSEFNWTFEPGQDLVPISAIEAAIAEDSTRAELIETTRNSPFCQDGHCERSPIYQETLQFSGDIYVFTGELDLQTRADEARTLARECRRAKRTNCFIEIVPDVQHGFNLPKPPRRRPFLDIAVAPVEESFLRRLSRLAAQLASQ